MNWDHWAQSDLEPAAGVDAGAGVGAGAAVHVVVVAAVVDELGGACVFFSHKQFPLP